MHIELRWGSVSVATSDRTERRSWRPRGRKGAASCSWDSLSGKVRTDQWYAQLKTTFLGSTDVTRDSLEARRKEFWETAPAFGGREEVWCALRSACEFAEKGEYAMSQAIVDGAGIILPSGESVCRYWN